MESKKYNIRVYAVIINDSSELLVSDEYRFGTAFTKFPGGGLEWGEGLKEGLKRELFEELGLELSIGELYFVNDFYQQSAFKKTEQLISFYYRVKVAKPLIHESNHFVPLAEDGERFRWIRIDEITDNLFTFPIDKVVGAKVKKDFN